MWPHFFFINIYIFEIVAGCQNKKTQFMIVNNVTFAFDLVAKMKTFNPLRLEIKTNSKETKTKY